MVADLAKVRPGKFDARAALDKRIGGFVLKPGFP